MFGYIIQKFEKWFEKRVLIHHMKSHDHSSVHATIKHAINNIDDITHFESMWMSIEINSRDLIEIAIANGYDVLEKARYKELPSLEKEMPPLIEVLRFYAKYGKLQAASSIRYDDGKSILDRKDLDKDNRDIEEIVGDLIREQMRCEVVNHYNLANLCKIEIVAPIVAIVGLLYYYRAEAQICGDESSVMIHWEL